MIKLQNAKTFLKYLLFSRHAKGHGIHSPFLYKLIREVFNDKTFHPGYVMAENMKKKMLKRGELIINGLGAGSQVTSSKERKISSIAKNSSIPRKYGRLLHRLVKSFKPDIIFELGTSLGISAAYMAAARDQTKAITVEGDTTIAGIARENLQWANLKNVEVWNEDFDDSISKLQENIAPDFMLFIDGNHTYDATLKYFKSFSDLASTNTIFIIDDIHWDGNMERAWYDICQLPGVTLSLDLHRLGIVLFNKELTKQHYIIRY